MRSTLGSKAIAVAMLLALLAPAAACSSDQRVAARRVSRGYVVHIGIAVPLEKGRIIAGHGVARAVELAVKQANQSGRLAEQGIRLETVVGDDQDDRRAGLDVANRFVSDPELVAVVGHLDSRVAVQVSPVYNANDVVAISPAASDPFLTQQGFRNVFRTAPTDADQGRGGADVAYRSLHKKQVYVVDDSSLYGVELADEFSKQFEKDGGVVLGREKTEKSDVDFRRVIENIRAQRPDIVFYGGEYFTAALLAKQMSAANVGVPLMGGDRIGTVQYIGLAGEAAAAGDLYTSVTVPLDALPGAEPFAAAYHAAYPEEQIQAFDPYAYDAANAIIDAVRRVAEELGPEQVTSSAGKKRLIADVLSTSLRGVTGRVAFDQYGDTLNRRVATYVVKDGAWQLHRR